MQDRLFSDSELLERLQVGLKEDYIAPWFQPVMDPTGTVMHSAEALPRFIDPEYGVISPMTFLDVAFKYNLLAEIGSVLLTKTCKAHSMWQSRGIAPGLVTINLSELELKADDVVKNIQFAMEVAGIDASCFGVEISDNLPQSESFEQCCKNIDALNELGIKIIIDDVGSNQADADVMKRLHASAAKIDRMTVSVLGEDDEALTRVKDLSEVVKSIGIPLIAKGVETRLQIDTLIELGCEGQQGFAIARPMPLDSFTEWLDLNTGWDVGDVA